MSRWRQIIAAITLALVVGAAHAERIGIERGHSGALQMHWLPAAEAPGARPAIVALPSCGGLCRGDGQGFDRRYPEYVERLHRAGYHVLMPDSFGSRGATSICAQAGSERTITVDMRRTDVLDAVRWLAGRGDVEARCIALVGWSHGAMTAVAGVVAFYRGCSALRGQPFTPQVPLLLLLGERDDWTPPQADFALKVYSDSQHGFDSAGPVRLRHGVDPRGVPTGGNPAARVQSQQEMDAFLARVPR